jgi:hypothetical protein
MNKGTVWVVGMRVRVGTVFVVAKVVRLFTAIPVFPEEVAPPDEVVASVAFTATLEAMTGRGRIWRANWPLTMIVEM